MKLGGRQVGEFWKEVAGSWGMEEEINSTHVKIFQLLKKSNCFKISNGLAYV